MLKNLGHFAKSECPSPKLGGMLENGRKGQTQTRFFSRKNSNQNISSMNSQVNSASGSQYQNVQYQRQYSGHPSNKHLNQNQQQNAQQNFVNQGYAQQQQLPGSQGNMNDQVMQNVQGTG